MGFNSGFEVLKQIFKKLYWSLWVVYMDHWWLVTKYGFYEMWEISWLAKQLLANQEVLCSILSDMRVIFPDSFSLFTVQETEGLQKR